MKFGIGRSIAAIAMTLVCMASMLYTAWGVYARSGFLTSNRDAEPDDLAFIENLDKQMLEAFESGKVSPALDHSKLRILASGKTKVNATIARLYLIKMVERKLSSSQSEQSRLDQELEGLITIVIYPRPGQVEGFFMISFFLLIGLGAILFVE